MRVVGGIYKGRRLLAPKGNDIRPTSERTRESIFNILSHGLKKWRGGVKDAIVLDLFCGTGALGLEALSRGAAHATFVEKSQSILAIAKRNAAVGIDDVKNTSFLKLDATKLPSPPFAACFPSNIAFLDPPYGQNLVAPTLICIKTRHWLAPGGLAVVETRADENAIQPSGYRILDTRLYGATKITFLKYDE